MIIFAYLETPPSHLSSYVHSILLCYLPSMKCQTCVALLIRALTNFAHLSSCQHNDSTTHCQHRESGILTLLGNYVALWTLFLLSGTACSVFFSLFCETHGNVFHQLKLDTPPQKWEEYIIGECQSTLDRLYNSFFSALAMPAPTMNDGDDNNINTISRPNCEQKKSHCHHQQIWQARASPPSRCYRVQQ